MGEAQLGVNYRPHSQRIVTNMFLRSYYVLVVVMIATVR